MEDNKQNATQQDKEVSLKEMIFKIGDWYRYLLRKWLTIVIIGIVGAGLGLTYSLVKAPVYEGELTFVLEDTKSSPLSTYAGIASQFGLDLGASTGVGVFSGDNILEFLKSRLMVEKALLSPIVEKGKTISLADHYIDVYELRKKWSKKEALKGIAFPPMQPRASYSRSQDSILNVLYKAILKTNLEVTKPDKKLSFISVKCSCLSETFSKIFTERLVKIATNFYVETKTQRSKANVDLLQKKADSIEALLNQKTLAVAKSQDINQNPVRRVSTVGLELVTRDKLMLQTVYGEVIKNLELSRMAMAQETPVIQIVDTPILPLEENKVRKLVALVLGGILGGLIAVIVLVMKKMFLDIVKS